MAGLVVVIGGKLDATYEASLARSQALAKASAIQIQREYARAQQIIGSASFKNFNSATSLGRSASSTVLNRSQVKSDAEEYAEFWAKSLNDAEKNQTDEQIEQARRNNRARSLRRQRAEARANLPLQGPDLDGTQRAIAAQNQTDEQIEAATRRNRARLLLRTRAANRAMREKALLEEAADVRAANLAAVSVVARQGGIGAASGGHGHRYGGRGGIVSEVAVIGHELLQGRGTGRVLGSISILAQRLGLLGSLVKSTAAAEIKLAFAENEKAGAMARATIATEASTVATKAEKDAALAASLAQNVRAKAATEAAEMASAAAKVTLGPLGWLLIAITAVVGALFVFGKALKNYTKDVQEMEYITSETAVGFDDEAEAIKKAAEATREFSKAMAKLNETHSTAVENSEEAIEALKRHAAATANLAEEKRKAALLDIEFQEKTGRISTVQAIRKRAEVEKQAVADKAAVDIATSKAELDQRASDSIAAQKNVGATQAAAKAASDALNKSPESIAKLARVEAANKKLTEATELATKADAAVRASKGNLLLPQISDTQGQYVMGSDGVKHFGSAAHFKAVASEAQGNLNDAQDALTPAETAAAAAQQRASEASTAADNLSKAFTKALLDYNAKVANTPAAVSAAQANITKQEKLDELAGNKILKPENLNAMQKLGAFTAQGGQNPLVTIGNRHTSLLMDLLAAQKANLNYRANQQGGVRH